MNISKISPGTSLASSTASAAAWKTFSPCSSRSDSLQVLLLNINHCAFEYKHFAFEYQHLAFEYKHCACSRCIIFNFLFRALPQQNGSSSLWGVRCLLKIKFYFFPALRYLYSWYILIYLDTCYTLICFEIPDCFAF